MIKKVKLGIPVIYYGEDLTISPPCIYCGKPVDAEKKHYFTRTGTFQRVHWGQGRKYGNWQLWPDSGSPSKYSINLPYCPEHIAPIDKKLRFVARLPWIGLFGGIILSLPLLFLIIPVLDLSRDTEVVFTFILLAVFILGGYFLGRTAYRTMARKNPILYDIAAFDQYGVEIENIENVAKGVNEPIRYYLKVWTSNEDIARRILNDFPGTIVYKGQELLDKK